MAKYQLWNVAAATTVCALGMWAHAPVPTLIMTIYAMAKTPFVMLTDYL